MSASFNKKALMRSRERKNWSATSAAHYQRTERPAGRALCSWLIPLIEKIAICEANKLGIPVIGVVEQTTGGIIPGNDDAIRAVQLYLTAMADAVLRQAEQ